MKGAVSEQVASQILSRVEQFINVDGYYTRRDELHIRGTETDAPPDWQARLAAELGELQLRAKIDRGGGAVYLTVFPKASRFPWINVALFAATLVSVSFSYTYIPLFTEGFGAALRAATDGRQFLHWQASRCRCSPSCWCTSSGTTGRRAGAASVCRCRFSCRHRRSSEPSGHSSNRIRRFSRGVICWRWARTVRWQVLWLPSSSWLSV